MIPVMQRGPGDCLRACIASIFEIAWEDAPDTENVESQHNAVNEWLKARGLTEWTLGIDATPPVLRRMVHVYEDRRREPTNALWPFPLATYYVGSGESPREGDHAVVMHLGRIVHDPHADGDMTIERIRSIAVYVARLGDSKRDKAE